MIKHPVVLANDKKIWDGGDREGVGLGRGRREQVPGRGRRWQQPLPPHPEPSPNLVGPTWASCTHSNTGAEERKLIVTSSLPWGREMLLKETFGRILAGPGSSYLNLRSAGAAGLRSQVTSRKI